MRGASPKRCAGFTRSDIVLAFAITSLLAIILLPMFFRDREYLRARGCQSNLRRIGQALLNYSANWDGFYPPNKLWNGRRISTSVPLSRMGAINKITGEPLRYQYGVNWVEALYPYVQNAIPGPCYSIWQCPCSSNIKAGSPHSAVSYAFNANMVEFNRLWIRDPGRLLMVRELDRLHDAVLRPISPTYGSANMPVDPFLDQLEYGAKKPNFKLHGEGSHILMADGRVRYFHVGYSPSPTWQSMAEWDSFTRKWYNYPINARPGSPMVKAIGITP